MQLSLSLVVSRVGQIDNVVLRKTLNLFDSGSELEHGAVSQKVEAGLQRRGRLIIEKLLDFKNRISFHNLVITVR